MPCWLCPSDIRLWLGFLGSRRGWSPACFCHDSIWYFLGFFANHLIVLLWSDCAVHWLAQKQARPVCQSHQVRKLGMLNKESCCKACVCYSPRRVSTAFHPYASQKLWTVLAPLPQQLLDSEIRINQFFRLQLHFPLSEARISLCLFKIPQCSTIQSLISSLIMASGSSTNRTAKLWLGPGDLMLLQLISRW